LEITFGTNDLADTSRKPKQIAKVANNQQTLKNIIVHIWGDNGIGEGNETIYVPSFPK